MPQVPIRPEVTLVRVFTKKYVESPSEMPGTKGIIEHEGEEEPHPVDIRKKFKDEDTLLFDVKGRGMGEEEVKSEAKRLARANVPFKASNPEVIVFSGSESEGYLLTIGIKK